MAFARAGSRDDPLGLELRERRERRLVDLGDREPTDGSQSDGDREHFVVVEAPGTPTYQLEIHTAAPTSVVDAAGNDTCADAIVIPSQSSVVYRGDTSTLANDVTSIYCGSGARSPDATFLLELTEATVVRLSTAGSSFDTTLLVFLEGAACSNFPYACDDDSGPGGTSSIERELPAGRYHVVVDGFGGHSAGPYVLRVDRGPFPP